MSSLAGYKSYILAALVIVYALAGFFTGNLDANAAMQLVFGGTAIATLRHGIATAGAAK